MPSLQIVVIGADVIFLVSNSEGYKCLDDGEFNLAIEKFTDAITLDRKRSCYYADRRYSHVMVRHMAGMALTLTCDSC